MRYPPSHIRIIDSQNDEGRDFRKIFFILPFQIQIRGSLFIFTGKGFLVFVEKMEKETISGQLKNKFDLKKCVISRASKYFIDYYLGLDCSFFIRK